MLKRLTKIFIADEELIGKDLIVLILENRLFYGQGFTGILKKYRNIQFIENKLYKKIGNIYSLYLTRNFIQEDFLLLDGDLVYESKIIYEILKNSKKYNFN